MPGSAAISKRDEAFPATREVGVGYEPCRFAVNCSPVHRMQGEDRKDGRGQERQIIVPGRPSTHCERPQPLSLAEIRRDFKAISGSPASDPATRMPGGRPAGPLPSRPVGWRTQCRSRGHRSCSAYSPILTGVLATGRQPRTSGASSQGLAAIQGARSTDEKYMVRHSLKLGEKIRSPGRIPAAGGRVPMFISRPVNSLQHIAEGGNRTHTSRKAQRILSPRRLPFRHSGASRGDSAPAPTSPPSSLHRPSADDATRPSARHPHRAG